MLHPLRHFSPLALWVLVVNPSLHAQLPDFVFDFEQPEGSAHVVNATAHGQEIALRQPTQVKTGGARFGAGSLEVSQSPDGATGGWYIYVKTMPELAAESSALTIASWVRLPEVGKRVVIAGRGALKGEKEGAFSFGIDRLQRAFFQINEELIQTPEFDVPAEQWIHLAMTYQAGVIQFYLDGVELYRGESAATTIPPVSADQASFTGLLHSSSGTGMDDFVFLGSKALEPAEIGRLVQDGVEKTHLK